MPMFNVDVLSTMRALECLEPEWMQLWHSSKSSVFQSPCWLLPWWASFHDDRELCAVTVRRAGKLVAFLPLYRQPRGDLYDLVFVGTGNTDHLDIIAAPGDEDAVRAALRALTELHALWDTLDLHEVPEGSPLLSAASDGTQVPEISIQSSCPRVPIPVSEHIAVGSAKLRQGLAYATRRVSEQGPLRRVDANSNNCSELFDELVRLHTERWRSRGEPGVLCDEKTQAFHRRAIVELSKHHLLRLFVLLIGEKRAGVYYGFSHASTSSYYLSGFDPQFASLSMGSLLIAEAVRMARSEGSRTFDFLRGREPYKYRWGATDNPSFRCRVRVSV